jgi:hypothetical protein
MFLPEEPGDCGRHCDDGGPGGDPAHVVVLLDGGGVRAFRGDRHMGAGPGLKEFDDAVQELRLPVGHAGDLMKPVGDIGEQRAFGLREVPDEFDHPVVGGGGMHDDGADRQ